MMSRIDAKMKVTGVPSAWAVGKAQKKGYENPGKDDERPNDSKHSENEEIQMEAVGKDDPSETGPVHRPPGKQNNHIDIVV